MPLGFGRIRRLLRDAPTVPTTGDDRFSEPDRGRDIASLAGVARSVLEQRRMPVAVNLATVGSYRGLQKCKGACGRLRDRLPVATRRRVNDGGRIAIDRVDAHRDSLINPARVQM